MFHSMEAEQNLLGALLLHNTPLVDLPLTENDFSIAIHREIFAQMRQLFAAKQSFGLPDFEAWSQGRAQNGQELSGYVRSLSESVIPATVSMTDWAETIRELSRKEAISQAIAEAGQGLTTQSSAEIVAFLHSVLIDRLDTRKQKTAEAVHAEIMTDLATPPPRYSTGLKSLNIGMAGGLYAGYTYGLCGKEKAGKTTFAHTISYNLAHAGHKHLYIALEMGSKQIEQRNLARTMGMNSLEFLAPTPALQQRIATVKKTPNVVYFDAPGCTLDEILHEIGIARLKHKITGFIIDYWQLVGGHNPRETEERHLRMTAQGLADYARKHGLWCILLAQMNKDGDLFGGGGLRKACDQLYFIETPSDKPDTRWLRMGASRYTPQQDVGGEMAPKFYLNKEIGPHFADTDVSRQQGETA